MAWAVDEDMIDDLTASIRTIVHRYGRVTDIAGPPRYDSVPDLDTASIARGRYRRVRSVTRATETALGVFMRQAP
ncbi:hypothetical protein HO173_002242 [Letharia columbiana]|uniref:Uncharacterized protein n=1 Tax=Letharia columbiana TaxID=112416 RepID=A0A8H6G382_9LECA|nr:uncharacterized protein HO173_002242 [Letharia columbiana]KAF6239696.1 hypothetical protein HO173_002242 [Letharia columbiana]